MVYIHIPYCRTRCVYCDFYSELSSCRSGSEAISPAFVDALCAEIASASAADVTAGCDTLYFGGGTPSLLSEGQLQRIVSQVRERCGKGPGEDFEEFTLEVNPDDIVSCGEEYVHALRRMGVNRISMGIQAFDDASLRRMGRRHDWRESRLAYDLLRREGFDNISIDIIFGFNPSSSYPDFKAYIRRGLESLCSPDEGGFFPDNLPEHISCYQLSVEPGSGLEKMLSRGRFTLPCDEDCGDQYDALCTLLRGLGYEHYEISNWARGGHRSLHNSAYWRHVPYVGFGPGAHSLFVDGDRYVRRWNEPSVKRYLEAFAGGSASNAGKPDFSSVRGCEVLTDEQIHDERMMLGLRTVEGVDGKTIPERKWFVSDSIILDML